MKPGKLRFDTLKWSNGVKLFEDLRSPHLHEILLIMPYFRRKFGDQSTLRAIDCGLEVRIPARMRGHSLRSILVRSPVGPIVVRGCMLRGMPLDLEELSSTNRNEIQTLCPH
jgi:hypothetical protein